MKYHRKFALDDRFAINDQHAGVQNIPTISQRTTGRHCYQLEGRDRMKIKAGGLKNPPKPQPGYFEEISSIKREAGVQRSARQPHKYRREMEQLGSIAEMG